MKGIFTSLTVDVATRAGYLLAGAWIVAGIMNGTPAVGLAYLALAITGEVLMVHIEQALLERGASRSGPRPAADIEF